MATTFDPAHWSVELRTLELMIQDRAWTQLKRIFHGTDPCLLYTCRNGSILVYIYLSNENKVGVRTLRKIREESASGGAAHCILISKEGLTPFASRELRESERTGTMEVFKKSELCMPIVHHMLVPQHTPLTKAQKAQLLSELGCKASALPKLKETDPVARYYCFQPGTVVKIMRTIGSLEMEPYFRIVC